MKFLAAAVQMLAVDDKAANLAEADRWIRAAAAQGARLVALPEVFLWRGDKKREKEFAEPIPGPASEALAGWARELGIYLLAGSLLEEVPGSPKAYNTSLLFDPAGKLRASYRKMHLFDVDLANGDSYRESANYAPGGQAVVADLPWGRLGLSICYDLRFPYLYRAMAKAGATFLAVPAAFTRLTGEAHWHTLLKARAIESQCFVFAAAQGGRHEHGRETFGHSLIISPWGQILAEGAVHPSVIFGDVELGMVEDVRTRVPSLRHDRTFDVVHAGGKSAAEVAS